MRRIFQSWFALLLSVISCHSQATESLQAPAPVNVTGTARSIAGDELYREYHRMGENYHNVDYQKPDGTWLAHKQISYGQNHGITSFRLHYPLSNRRETVVAKEGRVHVDILEGGKKTEHRMTYRDGDVIDSGFDSLIRANWQKVERKKTFTIRFLLFRRGSWVGMTLSPVDSGKCLEQYKSDITYCLSVRPESLLLRMLVPRLLIGYNNDKQLKLYVGPSNLKLEKREPTSIVITYQYSQWIDA